VKSGQALRVLRDEWFLGVSVLSAVAFLVRGEALFSDLSDPLWLGLVSTWLFAVIMGSALCVVRHADQLAERCREPYGTLILTLSVTSIEVVSISAVMLHGENAPTLARDTLFSVVMIILNGMVGVSLLIGAWRHREQQYNLQGANAYLVVVIPLAVLSLILPNFTLTTSGPTLSRAQETFLILASVSLYGAFLAVQTRRHRGYFTLNAAQSVPAAGAPHSTADGFAPHAILLVAYMLPVVFLAEQFARPLEHLTQTLHAPVALSGLIIALLVATPEGIGAVRAASANDMQRSMNIFLGSVLSTIGITVPAMLMISQLIGRRIVLGLQNSDFVMLLLTLAVSVVTFASGRTNVLHGAVHLILFASYLLLIFQG